VHVHPSGGKWGKVRESGVARWAAPGSDEIPAAPSGNCIYTVAYQRQAHVSGQDAGLPLISGRTLITIQHRPSPIAHRPQPSAHPESSNIDEHSTNTAGSKRWLAVAPTEPWSSCPQALIALITWSGRRDMKAKPAKGI